MTIFEKSLQESRQGKINKYVSVDDFLDGIEAKYILSSPAMTTRIRNAERDIVYGKGVKIKIGDL